MQKKKIEEKDELEINDEIQNVINNENQINIQMNQSMNNEIENYEVFKNLIQISTEFKIEEIEV